MSDLNEFEKYSKFDFDSFEEIKLGEATSREINATMRPLLLAD